jgi:hypothetical protein
MADGGVDFSQLWKTNFCLIMKAFTQPRNRGKLGTKNSAPGVNFSYDLFHGKSVFWTFKKET